MQVDLALGALAALAFLAAGLAGLVRRAGQGRPPAAWLLAPAGLGLACLAAALGWRAWQEGSWPGSTRPQALLALAGGAVLLRLVFGRRQAGRTETAWTLLAAAALVVAALVAGWPDRGFEEAPQAGTWLFGLRSLLVGAGLGGWVSAAAGSLPALWRSWRGGDVEGEAGGHAAQRAAYPWLTAALAASAAWSLAAYAVPWRDTAAELWLAIAWLLGGVYLHVAEEEQQARLGGWAPVVVVLAGLAAAVLASWQVTTLFTQ